MRKQLIRRPRKRLGQNFLSDRTILEKIVSSAGVSENDTVVEVGPGYGGLTGILADRAKKVIALELDTDLFDKLKRDFSQCSNVEFVNCDVLDYPFEAIETEFKIVSNPPYYLTTPLLYKLIENRYNISTVVMTLQKEVAQRVAAPFSTKSYGSLTLYYSMFADSEICFEIGRENFYPVPEVDSAVIKIDFLKKARLEVDNIDVFFDIVKASFSHRRKSLKNSLRKSGVIKDDINLEEDLLSIGIKPIRRAETLSLDEFVRMSDHFSAVGALK